VNANPSDDPKNNFLSNWDIMHLVLPAAFMMAQKEDNRREHRTPIRVRRSFGVENIEDEDPMIELGDLLGGLGVKNQSTKSELAIFTVRILRTVERQVPDRNLSRMCNTSRCNTSRCIRLSQLRAVILGVNTPFGNVFLDVLTANGG
jgi:hypothetical protein